MAVAEGARAAKPGSRFFRNSLFGMLAGTLTALGSLFATIIVARSLSVEGAGALALGVWVAAMALVVADLGIPVTIARFLPELSAVRSDDVRSFAPSLARPFRIMVALCFVAILGFGLLAASGQTNWAVGGAGEQSLLFWILVGCVFLAQAFSSFGLSQLRGMQRFDKVARLNAVSFAFQMTVTVVGSLLLGVPGALLGYLAGNIVPAILYGAAGRAEGPIAPELRQRARVFARTSWLTAVISAVTWTRIEVVPLQLYWGVASVGLFSVALTLSQIATQIPTLLMSGLLPLFAERHVAGDREGLRRAYASTLVFLSFLLLPACFGMAAVAPALVPTLFGQDFAPAVPAAEVLAFVASIAAISSVNANVIYATEKADFYLKAGIASAVLVGIAAVTIVPAYGLVGATWSRAAIQTAISLLSFVYVSRTLGLSIPFRPLALLTIAALLCALAARLVVDAFQGPLELPAAVLAGAAVYVAAVRILRALPRADADRLRNLISRSLPGRFSPVTERLCHLVLG